MANEVLIQDVAGSSLNSILFAKTGGEFDPASNKTNLCDDIGTETVDVDIDLDSLASGAARQSAKADLGAVRALYYNVLASIDFTGETPTDGASVQFYWAPSTSGTADEGNIDGNAGTEGAVPNTVVNSVTYDEFCKHCIFIGSLATHADGGVITGFIGTFSPPTRYGNLVVRNESGDVFEADAVESHVVFQPLVYEIQ